MIREFTIPFSSHLFDFHLWRIARKKLSYTDDYDGTYTMSDETKDDREPIEQITLTTEMKKMIITRLKQVIGKSLEFPQVLRMGIERSQAYVSLLPLDELQDDMPEEVMEAAKGMNIFQMLMSAQFVFGGMMIPTDGEELRDRLQFVALVTDDGGVGIYTFDERVTKDMIHTLIDDLLIVGLQNHRLINRVLTHSNFALPIGTKILASGSGCRVSVGEDGSYSIEIKTPDDVETFISNGMPPELKEKMNAITVESDELCDDEECDCPICQIASVVKARRAKEAGKIH